MYTNWSGEGLILDHPILEHWLTYNMYLNKSSLQTFFVSIQVYSEIEQINWV